MSAGREVEGEYEGEEGRWRRRRGGREGGRGSFPHPQVAHHSSSSLHDDTLRGKSPASESAAEEKGDDVIQAVLLEIESLEVGGKPA
eukprot:583158-Hanusia_phi.AAC.1